MLWIQDNRYTIIKFDNKSSQYKNLYHKKIILTEYIT